MFNVYSHIKQIKALEEASEVFVDNVKDVAVGLYDVAKDTVVGWWTEAPVQCI